MDKTEYKIRAEEIRSLMKVQRFADAVKIADTIDWKRVKSVGMLCMISDLYKINRRLEESRDILLLAYDRSPTRRDIVYSLCELAIAMGEFVQAVEYYKEFVRLAPRNTARYILQYKLYEAQEVSLEERIAVLEEYKKHDYNEKWAYELAYLYHRVGLTTECIEECDELFLYMREGRFVMKALELKALHEPLSPEQKAVYTKYKAENSGMISAPVVSNAVPGRDVQEGSKTPTKEMPQIPEDFEAGDLAASPTNEIPTGEIQAELDGFTEGTSEVYHEDKNAIYEQDTQVWQPEESAELQSELQGDEASVEEALPVVNEYEVPTVNVGDYNTVDLQKEIAENLKEVLIESPEAALFADAHGPQVVKEGDLTEDMATGEMLDDTTSDVSVPEIPSMSEVFYEDHTEDLPVVEEPQEELQEEPQEETTPVTEDTKIWEAPTSVTKPGPELKKPLADELKDKEIAASIAASTLNEHALYKGAVFTDEPLQDEIPGAVIKPNVRYKINNHFDKMLSQDYDGQISMAIDDVKQVEDQITGQISIDDLLNGWETYKKDQQEKQLQNVRNKVASETGELFKDFDENLQSSFMAEENPANEERIKEVLTPGMQELTAPVHTEEVNEVPEVAETFAAVEQPVVETVEEISEPVVESVPVQEPAPVEDPESQDIMPVDDLQNTRSMVQITGDELEYVETTESVENQESEYPEEMEESSEESELSGGMQELTYSEADNSLAAEVDLGETTEIEASEVEEALVEKSVEPATEPSNAEIINTETSEDDLEDIPEFKEALEEELEDNSGKKNIEETERSEAKADRQAARREPLKESADSEENDEKEEKAMETRVRVMTPEEKELFGPYIHHKKSRKQIIEAIDNLSMAAYTNNAIVTGEEGAGTVNLAKGLIKAVQATDSNFSGKVAMISAITLNKRTVSTILEKIVNGALIIRRAADLKEDTVATLLKQLQIENKGYIVVIEDTKDDIDRLLDKYPELKKCFNVRVDIEALDDDSLVAYAKQYALEKEHVIDNLGILALHQRISERQTLDHEVTVTEVKDMVDEAIYYADKRSLGHVVDVLFRKRFDEEDMIILREKDFLH